MRVDDEKTSVSKINENDIALDSENIDYKVKSKKGLTFSDGNINVTSKDSRLIISTGKIENSEVYVVFKNLNRAPVDYELYKDIQLGNNANKKIEEDKFDASEVSYYPYRDFNIYINKPGITKRLINADGDNQGFTDVKDYIANLGYYESTEGNIIIDFKTIGEYTFDSIEVIAVSQDNFDRQAKKLGANRLKVTTLHDNYVKGTVNADYDGLLYLNIPYNDGWKVYIDGEEQETYVADIAFTGVDITKGEHNIELKYRPAGFTAGLCMSAAGIVVLAVILIYKGVKRRNLSDKN